MGLNSSDLRVQGWNCNSLTKELKTWRQFMNKLKNSNENCFILIDLRLDREHEREYGKLWDGPIFFNSFSSNQRGLVVPLKDSLPAENIKIENIMSGDYTRLIFVINNTKILLKCCYAPIEDMTSFESESNYDILMMVGYFNVAPDHNKDTLGYLHVNNPNTRRFMDRMKSLNMMTDVFRHKHPDLRQYSFNTKQTKN